MSIRVLPVLTLLLALGPQAFASGFKLQEQSAAAEGQAMAGVTAGAPDLSSMFWNPAVLPLFPGTQMSVGASWIGVKMDLSGATATRAPGFQPSDQPIPGPSSLPNAVSQPVLPTLYAAWALSDRVSMGFSFNVPFGLVTNYPDDFIGRYHALETNLKTYDLSPSLAWRANDQWTFGVAFVARRATAQISEAVDFGAVGNAQGIPAYLPGTKDTVATLSGNCWAYGFKAGLTWQPTQDLRFGLAYQGQTNLDIKGYLGYGTIPSPINTQVTNTNATTTVDLPATASGGFTWKLGPSFTLNGEVQWTGWSCFKTLDIAFASGQPDDITNEDWKDTMFYSLGGTWSLSEDWAFRFGAAYDRSPVDDAHRTPRIPDSDRTWVSLGLAWYPSKTTAVDFGATRIFAPNVPIALTTGNAPTDPNYFRGNLNGTYSVGATILAASIRWTF